LHCYKHLDRVYGWGWRGYCYLHIGIRTFLADLDDWNADYYPSDYIGSHNWADLASGHRNL
jgi:hypothetical protein